MLGNEEREALSRDVKTSREFGDDVDRRKFESNGEATIYTVATIVVARQQSSPIGSMGPLLQSQQGNRWAWWAGRVRFGAIGCAETRPHWGAEIGDSLARRDEGAQRREAAARQNREAAPELR